MLVNGVCLTATEPGRGVRRGRQPGDAPAELARGARGGDRVNLELALRPADRLGGHIVQGHVDGLATLAGVTEEGMARNLRLEAAPELCDTWSRRDRSRWTASASRSRPVDERGFEASLSRRTLQRTNLTDAIPGHRFNLEVDMIAKYVEKLVNR